MAHRVLDGMSVRRLLVLIDEWAEIDSDIQPFVAEYLKKAFFANPRAVIKIAALEYRSSFGTRDDGPRVGFELGGTSLWRPTWMTISFPIGTQRR